MCNGSVGLSVVLLLELGFWSLPYCTRRIDLLGLAVANDNLDWKQDMVRIGRDNPPEFVGFEIFLRLLLQVKYNFGAARAARCLRFIGRRNFKATAS